MTMGISVSKILFRRVCCFSIAPNLVICALRISTTRRGNVRPAMEAARAGEDEVPF